MKLNSTQTEQALSQFEAEVLPDDHPALKQLSGIYGGSHVLPGRQRPQRVGARRNSRNGSPNWRNRTEADSTDLEAVTLALLEGPYENPVRVIGFNTAEGWSEDVSADVAHELRRRCDLQLRDVPFSCRILSTPTRGATTIISCRCRSVGGPLGRPPPNRRSP
jgi:hypothetical protein